jgi:glycosyltransferase involved in cell wall biosynthesis
MSHTRVHVAVVIPAYRVDSRIEETLRTIPALVRTIVVVDDASPDATAERVGECDDPRVRLVRHARNLGVGGATVTGMRVALEAGADIVVKMDGDGQMDPKYLPCLLEPLLAHRADLAKGNRYSHLTFLEGMPLVRRFGNASLTFLVKAASGHWRMFDPTNGYFAARSDLLRRLDLSRLPQRYFFESGLLIELGLVRAKVEDVPIPARYRGEISSLSVATALVEFPLKLLWGGARRIVRHYFLYDFSAVSAFLLCGAPMFLFGIIFGGVEWRRSVLTGVAATTGTVMVAALPVILGFQLLLQALVVDIANAPSEPLSPPLALEDGLSSETSVDPDAPRVPESP